MINILYIHGMGGGGDSRIPSILNSALYSEEINVIVRTYDFDPETASEQIRSWVCEIRPALIIGESLGAVHALRIEGIPHLLISPALNAPFYLGRVFAFLSLIPGVTSLLDRIYLPRTGDRQRLHFTYQVLRKYIAHGRQAMKNTPSNGSKDYFHAFIGTRDHYRRTGVVSIRSWKKCFGQTYTLYEGTHFTEEEHIYSLIVPMVINLLKNKA